MLGPADVSPPVSVLVGGLSELSEDVSGTEVAASASASRCRLGTVIRVDGGGGTSPNGGRIASVVAAGAANMLVNDIPVPATRVMLAELAVGIMSTGPGDERCTNGIPTAREVAGGVDGAAEDEAATDGVGVPRLAGGAVGSASGAVTTGALTENAPTVGTWVVGTWAVGTWVVGTWAVGTWVVGTWVVDVPVVGVRAAAEPACR
jgi:hypothetical protein